MWEQRYAWGRAYRNGRVVCQRVDVTILRDPRLGLASRQARRHVTARFLEGVDTGLRHELERLVRAKGATAARLAERLHPIEIVAHDQRGEHHIRGWVQPPTSRFGPLEEIEFRVREPA